MVVLGAPTEAPAGANLVLGTPTAAPVTKVWVPQTGFGAVATHTGDAGASGHETDPRWHGYDGVQVPPSSHSHSPVRQIRSAPHGVLSATKIPVDTQADWPVAHEVSPT